MLVWIFSKKLPDKKALLKVLGIALGGAVIAELVVMYVTLFLVNATTICIDTSCKLSEIFLKSLPYTLPLIFLDILAVYYLLYQLKYQKTK